MRSSVRVEGRRTLKAALARNGQRFTRQRARIYECLCVMDHPTADEVYAKVKQTVRSVSLATVYKALETLARCGLAQKLCYGDGAARYEANPSDHPHLRDVQTGQVIDVPPHIAAELLGAVPTRTFDRIEKETGFRVLGVRLELLGQSSPAEAGLAER